MLNFYEFYNKTGLDKEEYSPLIEKLDAEKYTNELEPIEHIIKKEPEHAFFYAKEVIKGRFPEAEPYIMNDSWYAYSYTKRFMDGRWKEAESVIIKNPRLAWLYALYILKSRWVDAESVIKKDIYWWKKYCGYFKL